MTGLAVRPLFVLVLAALLAVPAAPASAACSLEEGDTGKVLEVIDAETLRLEDGREVRLVNVISPRRPLWLDADARWYAAETVRAALAALALGREVRIAHGGRQADRNGRVLAHVFVLGTEGGDGDIWVQGELVLQGQARAASFADNRACVEDLLAYEASAREGRAGLWADPHYRIRDALDVGEIAKLLNHFHLVEGTVREVAAFSNRTYLNFGEDYREDFTLSISRGARGLFEDAGIDLDALHGARIRVRGFIRNRNGPMIEVSHPEQIELIE